MLHGGPAKDPALIPAEDLGSRAEVIGVVFPQLVPHQLIAAQVVDVPMERHIVRRPVSFLQYGKKIV